MKLLLDTHVLLWAAAKPDKLSQRARAALEDPEQPLWFSAVSVAELAIKLAIGKLQLPEPLGPYVHATLRRLSAQELPLTSDHAAESATLPFLHKDPFDRLLVAQARVEEMHLVTADGDMARYDVPVLW